MQSASTAPALRMIDAHAIQAALPVGVAVDVLHAAFAAGATASAPHRTHLTLADALFLVMPATGTVGSGEGVGGVKVVTIRPANKDLGAPTVQAVYVLFGGPTLAPLAVMDGPALTNLRTSAVSALATRLLALPDASSLVMFGAGAQARAHVSALAAVRPIRDLVVVSRSADRAEALVDFARTAGLNARIGVPDDVATADVVCTCTTSETPLFDGTLLRPGVHVVGVGAYLPYTRELDDATLRRGRVVVEDRMIALAEAGELAIPVAAGWFGISDVAADLTELCSGAPVRRSEQDITVFKSVGMAGEDLAIAEAVYRGVVGADGETAGALR